MEKEAREYLGIAESKTINEADVHMAYRFKMNNVNAEFQKGSTKYESARNLLLQVLWQVKTKDGDAQCDEWKPEQPVQPPPEIIEKPVIIYKTRTLIPANCCKPAYYRDEPEEKVEGEHHKEETKVEGEQLI